MKQLLLVLLGAATWPSWALAQNHSHPATLHGPGSPQLVAQATRAHQLGSITLYTIALYVQPPSSRAEMLSSDVAKALRIEVTYQPDLRRPPLIDWQRELIPTLLTPAAVAHLRGTFAALKRGDVVLIEYVPGRGTAIRVNRNVAVTGAHHDVMLAFLDHWLGQRPVSEDVKRQLQGGA